MERLLDAGKIHVASIGPPSKQARWCALDAQARSALATALAPSVVPAPARFSTNTGPKVVDSCCATSRPMTSIGPPAITATTSLIGRLG
jgi:hypothetical protein